jgi:formylglycine-generating enzyme required for sulfatase activity
MIVVMFALRIVAIVFMITGLGSAAAETPKGVAALEKQLEAARADLARSEEVLVEVFERSERAFKALVESVEARTILRDAIGTRVREIAPSFQERLTGKRTGKAPQPAAATAIAADWLLAAIAKTTLDPALRSPLATALADPARAPLAADSLGADRSLEAAIAAPLDQFFGTEREFAALWNDGVFKTVPEAVDYSKKFAIYREAGSKLDRARSPDKFDDSGQRLPPGMVLVKGGSYEIGPDQGFFRKAVERRASRITLKPFFIDRTEVTVADYAKWLQSLPPDELKLRLPAQWTIAEDGSIVGPPGKDDHPVTGVSFNDAFAYAAAIGKRLPTEEEWEAAARGPKAFKYPWGDAYEAGRANDRDANRNDTAPVGSYPDGASAFGVLDLCGNVEEWTASTDSSTKIEQPLESSLVQAVIRGGNYNSNADVAAATYRWFSPGLTTKKATLGFRCAMNANKP